MTRKQKRAWKHYRKALHLCGDDFKYMIKALELALEELKLVKEGLVYIKPLDLFVDRVGDIFVTKKVKRAEKLTIIRQRSKTTVQLHKALWPTWLTSRKT